VRKKLSLPPLVTVGIALLAVVGGSGPSYAKDNEVIDYEPKVVLSKYEVEAFSYDKRSRPGFPIALGFPDALTTAWLGNESAVRSNCKLDRVEYNDGSKVMTFWPDGTFPYQQKCWFEVDMAYFSATVNGGRHYRFETMIDLLDWSTSYGEVKIDEQDIRFVDLKGCSVTPEIVIPLKKLKNTVKATLNGKPFGKLVWSEIENSDNKGYNITARIKRGQKDVEFTVAMDGTPVGVNINGGKQQPKTFTIPALEEMKVLDVQVKYHSSKSNGAVMDTIGISLSHSPNVGYDERGKYVSLQGVGDLRFRDGIREWDFDKDKGIFIEFNYDIQTDEARKKLLSGQYTLVIKPGMTTGDSRAIMSKPFKKKIKIKIPTRTKS